MDDSLELGASALGDVTTVFEPNRLIFDPTADYSDLFVPLPPEQQPTKRDEKFTARCDYCDVLLSSMETLFSHVNGIRHKKVTGSGFATEMTFPNWL